MDSGKDFRAPWSRLLKIVTILSATLLLAAPITTAFAPLPGYARVLVITLPLAILLGCALFTIRGYTLRNGQLSVHRLFWETPIDLTGLREIDTGPHHLVRSIRLFGNGGLFSFTGWYRNKTLGTYRAFVTDPARAVILKFPNRTIVVSPDPHEEFIRLLNPSSTLTHHN